VGARRARVIAQVLESVDVVEPAAIDGQARFGASVTVEDANGQRMSYRIVGPMRSISAHQISSASPVARALSANAPENRVVLHRPKGDVTVTVVAVV